MCIPTALAAIGLGGATAGATAAGATAAATTVAGTLQTIGTVVSIGGALAQGIAGYQASKANVAAIEAQKKTEAQITAIKDQRTRAIMQGQIAQQRAELAARNVSMDSVTAIMLGQTAAQEMSFESQSIRSTGTARQTELTAAQTAAKADGFSSLLRGTTTAAGSFLNAAPDIWPGFMDKRVGKVLK